jgi:hypothetical protein
MSQMIHNKGYVINGTPKPSSNKTVNINKPAAVEPASAPEIMTEASAQKIMDDIKAFVVKNGRMPRLNDGEIFNQMKGLRDNPEYKEPLDKLFIETTQKNTGTNPDIVNIYNSELQQIKKLILSYTVENGKIIIYEDGNITYPQGIGDVIMPVPGIIKFLAEKGLIPAANLNGINIPIKHAVYERRAEQKYGVMTLKNVAEIPRLIENPIMILHKKWIGENEGIDTYSFILGLSKKIKGERVYATFIVENGPKGLIGKTAYFSAVSLFKDKNRPIYIKKADYDFAREFMSEEYQTKQNKNSKNILIDYFNDKRLFEKEDLAEWKEGKSQKVNDSETGSNGSGNVNAAVKPPAQKTANIKNANASENVQKPVPLAPSKVKDSKIIGGGKTPAELVEMASKATVQIESSLGIGSGVYISHRGLPMILTASHVIGENKEVELFSSDGGYLGTGEVFSKASSKTGLRDIDNTDLAIVLVNPDIMKGRDPLSLSLKEPKFLENMLAVGFPHATFSTSIVKFAGNSDICGLHNVFGCLFSGHSGGPLISLYDASVAGIHVWDKPAFSLDYENFFEKHFPGYSGGAGHNLESIKNMIKTTLIYKFEKSSLWQIEDFLKKYPKLEEHYREVIKEAIEGKKGKSKP